MENVAILLFLLPPSDLLIVLSFFLQNQLQPLPGRGRFGSSYTIKPVSADWKFSCLVAVSEYCGISLL